MDSFKPDQVHLTVSLVGTGEMSWPNMFVSIVIEAY